MNNRPSQGCAQVYILFLVVAGIAATTKASKGITVPPSTIITIADTPTADETSPVVAFDPNRHQYLVAYASYSVNSSFVYATCINMEGEVIMDYSLGSGINPDIVYDPSHDDYILVWELGITSTTSHIMGSRIAGSCCTGPACGGTPFIISDDRPGYEAWPAIAYNTNANHQDFLIVWHDNSNFSGH